MLNGYFKMAVHYIFGKNESGKDIIDFPTQH